MSRSQILIKLNNMGIAASFDEILSSTNTAALYVSMIHPHAKVLVVGSQGLKDEMLQVGLRVVEDPTEADFLVAGFDKDLSYAKLEKALIAHLHGARFIATNDDGMLPTESGYRPGAGAVIGAISGMIKQAPEVIVGKPNEKILKEAFVRMNIDLDKAIIIGDSIGTDVRLAINLDIPSVLVLTGNTRSREEAVNSTYVPSFIVDSIADVLNLMQLNKPCDACV